MTCSASSIRWRMSTGPRCAACNDLIFCSHFGYKFCYAGICWVSIIALGRIDYSLLQSICYPVEYVNFWNVERCQQLASKMVKISLTFTNWHSVWKIVKIYCPGLARTTYAFFMVYIWMSFDKLKMNCIRFPGIVISLASFKMEAPQ